MPEAEPEAVSDPADCGQGPPAFTRDYVAEIDSVGSGDRPWVVSRINTDALDRYDTVVDPAGMDRSAYLKNPVVLWQHGKDPVRGMVPIGRNAWIKPRPRERDVLAKTLFAGDEFSRGIFELYRDGTLKGWSINGEPIAAPGMVGPPTAAERASRPELARCKTIYRGWRLKEYSAVTFPGNPECDTTEVSRAELQRLALAASRGLWVPDLVRPFLPPLPQTPSLPPLIGRTLDEVLASVVRRSEGEARALLREALADARDLARGKV